MVQLLTLLGHLFHGTGEKLINNDRLKPQKSASVETETKENTKETSTLDMPKGKRKKFIIIAIAVIVLFVFIITVVGLALFVQTKKSSLLSADIENLYLWYIEQLWDNETSELINGLGECYFYGKGIDIDYINAFECFKRAAEAGDTSAQYNLGVCYSNGYGTDIDDEQALKYFMLAEKKVADAKAYVGYYNCYGWGGLEANKDSGFKLLKAAQKDGSVMSLYFQAIYNYYEDEVQNNYERAASFLCNN